MARTQRPEPGRKAKLFDQAGENRAAARRQPYDQGAEPAVRRGNFSDAEPKRPAERGSGDQSAENRRGRPAAENRAAPAGGSARGRMTDPLPADTRGGTRHGVFDQETGRTSRGMRQVELNVPAPQAGRPARSERPAPASRPADPADLRRRKKGKKRRFGARRPVPVRPVPPPAEDEDEEPPVPLRDRGRAARRRARRRSAIVFGVLVVLALGVWASVMFVFKISEITVSGTSVYDQSVIIQNFSYHIGDNLFTFSTAKAARQLEQALPYLETVKVSRLLPGSVHIAITPSVEQYCFAMADGSYTVTSPSLKVLRTGDNTASLLTVRGIGFDNPVPGMPLAVSDPDQAAALSQMLQALSAGTLQNVSELDLTDVWGITLKCENRFVLKLGTTVELDYKLRLAAETIYNQLPADATGVIDLSSAATSRSAYYTAQAIG